MSDLREPEDPFDRLLAGGDRGDAHLAALVQRATQPATAAELRGLEPTLAAFRTATRPSPIRRGLRHLHRVPAAAAAVAASVVLVGGGVGIALTHALSTPSTPTITVAPTTTKSSSTSHASNPPASNQHANNQHTTAHGQGPIPGIPRSSSPQSVASFFGICTAWEADQHAVPSLLPALEQSTEYQHLAAAARARNETVAALCGALTGTSTKGVAHPNSGAGTGLSSHQPIVPSVPSVPGRASQLP